MNKITLLFSYLLIICITCSLQSLGQYPIGITVAGGNGEGAAANQLDFPSHVVVDANGNVYVTDTKNRRVQKWAPGATAGVTVAGGNGIGSAANQLATADDVALDINGNMYVADRGNNRVLKYAPGSTNGVTVAGGNGKGPADNQVTPKGIFIDAGGSIYVTDSFSNRVQKWAPGATSGITVAGGNGKGSATNQLNAPSDVFVDPAGIMYIADIANYRIVKWAPGAQAGTTIAQGDQLSFFPTDIFVDQAGYLYYGNSFAAQVFRYPPGSSTSVAVAGTPNMGSGPNQLFAPTGVFPDGKGNLYVADQGNYRVQKFVLPVIPSSPLKGITVAGGNGSGTAANQFSRPDDVVVDAAGNMYVSDETNNRVQKWAPGATSGVTVAGGHDTGSAANQLHFPQGIFVDAAGNLYIADNLNYRVQKWAPGASSGVTVAGGHGRGSAANQITPLAIFVDPDGNIYVADNSNSRVQKWAPGAQAGTTVAVGTDINHPINPTDVFVDAAGNIYVGHSDFYNSGVLKFAPGASTGTLVAGGNGNGYAANQLGSTIKIYVDEGGNIFIADPDYNRIQKWAPGATEGIVVAGGNSKGTGSNQLSLPYAVYVDEGGAMYVADQANNRIQKFYAGSGLSYKYFEGTFTSLPDFNTLTPVSTGKSGSTDITARTPGRSDNFAFIWQGYINITTVGTYTFETVSDDGSKLYFNAFYNPSATATVNNDGLHAPFAATGTVNVPAVGLYPIAMTFFEKDGGEQMQVYWTGPGIPRQLIPNSAFVQSPPPPATGLAYRYYEGTWNTLPDFSSLAPIKTGNSANVDINVRTPGRNDFFGFVWEGYINITTPGTYTFETVSDDGSKIYFNSLYDPLATATVSNDGLHAPVSATGIVNISNPGAYPITFTFFEKDGGEQMQVYWSGPGIPRQLIPNSAFMQAPPPPQNGLAYKYYEGTWNTLPDFSLLTPVKTGNTPNVDISIRPTGRERYFGFVWEGYINIPTAGNYTFETISDDGSKLYFNSLYNPSATPMVSNDGLHAPVSATGTVNIPAAGTYPISMTFFEKDGGEQMQVYWTGTASPRQLIPDAAFRGSAGTIAEAHTQPVAAEAKGTGFGDAGKMVVTSIYPNPFSDRFNIAFYNASAANDITVSVSDMAGRKVFTHHPGKVAAGNNTLAVPLSGTHLPEGMYLVTLHVNGAVVKTQPLLKAR